MPQEIKIDGIGISPDVLTAIVSPMSRASPPLASRTLPPTLSP